MNSLLSVPALIQPNRKKSAAADKAPSEPARKQSFKSRGLSRSGSLARTGSTIGSRAGSRAGSRNGKRRSFRKFKDEKEPVMPDGPRTYLVGGWSGLQTIAEALNLAKDGDVVAVLPGKYPERVELKVPGVELRGAEASNGASVLGGGIISSCSTGTVTGLTIERGVDVEQGGVVLNNCTIRFARHGVAIHAVANPIIRNNTITDVELAGIYAFPGARGMVEANTIKGDKRKTVGIFSDGSNTTFKKNTVLLHATGVYNTNASTPGPTVTANVISEVSGIGLYITNGAQSACTYNTIHSCGHYGILVEGDANPSMEKNTVQVSTVCIRKGCRSRLRNNTFTGRLIDENEKG